MQTVEVVEEPGRREFGPREKLRRGNGEDRHQPGHATRHRPRCAGILVLVGCWAVLMSAMAGPLAAPAIAGPARYVLDKCDSELPGGSVQGAVFTGPRPFAGAQDCNLPGGSIFVVQQGEAAWSSAQWSLPLPPPPGGYTESVTVTGSMCNGAQADSGTVAFAVGPGWAFTCSPETHTYPVDSAAGSLGLVYLGCEGQCAGEPEAWAKDFAAVEVDPVAPVVQSLGGTLMAGGVVRGHQSIDAVAGDEGGGVSSVALRVNGQPLEAAYRPQCAIARVENPSYAGIVTDVPTPCPPTVEPSWTVDTATYPFHEGTNSVTVCAQDFSTIGPPNEGCSTGQVTVDNSCTESTVAGGEALNARFQGSGEGQITVPYGSGAEIEGQLDDGAGEPVSGATVCVQVQTQESSAPMETTATATTDASGHFAYQLPAGPDRQVLLGYRHDSFEVSETISYHADALPQLRLHPNRLHSGGRVHILGSLPGPEAAGRVVVLQASALHGHRWLTFRRATTDQGGGFQASYRFGATTRTTTYRIRAVVPSQRGYPYEPGHSRPGRVKVRARRHRVVKRTRHGHRRSRPPGSGRGRSAAGPN